MSVEQTIVCDECSAIIAAASTLISAVQDARSIGAYVTRRRAVCASCRGPVVAEEVAHG